MTMSPPLLSEYKKIFAGKRFCQNALGGPRLFGVPFQFVLIQICLYFTPILLIITFKLCCHGDVEVYWKVLGAAISFLILEIFLDTAILFLKKDRNIVKPRSPSVDIRLFAQEDSVKFESWLGSSTWSFVAPNVTFTGSHLMALLASTTSFAMNSPLFFHKKVLGLQILGSFVLCSARFSSTLGTPPEIATFDTNQKRSVLYRPFYTGFIGLAYFLKTGFLTLEVDKFPYLLTLCILPVGWGLGFLPPLDSFLPWTIETVLFQLGGAPSYFYFGSFIGLCLAILYVALIFVIGSHCTLGVALQCLFGYLILLDTSSFLSLASKFGHRRWNLRKKPRLLATILCFCVSLTGAIAVSELQTDDMQKISAQTFIAITIASCAVVYGLEIVWKSSSLEDNVASGIHFVLNSTLMILIHVWLTVEIVAEGRRHGVNEIRSLFHLMAIALSIRGYAVALSDAKSATFDMVVAAVLRMTADQKSFLNNLEFTTVLFIAAFGRSVGIRFWRNLCSAVRIAAADLASPILDNKRMIGALCISLLPISICSLILASILEGSPVTPVFTLPAFLLGFPRPISFWKGKWCKRKSARVEDHGSLDEAVYAAIGPSLVTEFVRKATIGGRGFKSREAFVARHEDRILFLRVVGSGLNFVYVAVRGLELQEPTSCHHQESAWMDEIFETKNLKTYSCGPKNLKQKLTVVWPFFEVNVPSYSESKSTLPYLTLDKDIELLEQFFYRAFSYLWIKEKPAFQGEAYWKSSCLTKTKAYRIIENHEKDKGIAEFDRPSSRGWPLPSEIYVTQDRSTTWIKKCVGECIPSNAIKERMEKLVAKIWNLAHTKSDFREIKLHRYFENNFLEEKALKLKTLDSDNILGITKKAFRYATKLTLDEIYQLNFTEDSTESSDNDTFAELCRFETEFLFCQPNEISALIRTYCSIPLVQTARTVLSVMPKEGGMSQMKMFVPELNGVKYHVGGIDPGVLEGIWANLNLELLYLTSDDDERFSIQHDRYLMRNLCTECADTPLGYPVYEATFRVDLFKNFRIETVA